MPSSQTANYQLSQWVKSDQVLMDDFNSDNAKIDAAIKAVDVRVDGKASSSSLSSLQSTVNGKASQSDLNALQSTVSQLQSTLSSLQTTVSKKQDAASAVKLMAGSYTGNGSASRTISLGWRPKAVYICAEDGRTYVSAGSYYYIYGGLVVDGAPLRTGNTTCAEITASGFKVYQNDNVAPRKPWMNYEDGVFHYVAFS